MYLNVASTNGTTQIPTFYELKYGQPSTIFVAIVTSSSNIRLFHVFQLGGNPEIGEQENVCNAHTSILH